MEKQALRINLRRNLVAGVLLMIPLWITWLVFSLLFNQLSRLGLPWVRALSRALREISPTLAEWLLMPAFQYILAVLISLLFLYLLGWIATRVVGRHLLAMVESLIERIPLVQLVYGATKKLIAVLQQKPEQVQRVVLIEFPSADMRAVGFVTQILTDEKSGKKLAAVYVPTTPNPTSGYLEIVPVERLVSTDWSLDEAMAFIISGGTISPGDINYSNNGSAAQRPAAREQQEKE